WMPCALVLALLRAGNNMLARIAMMAMTTSSSIKVNPVCWENRSPRSEKLTEPKPSMAVIGATSFTGLCNRASQIYRQLWHCKDRSSGASARVAQPRFLRACAQVRRFTYWPQNLKAKMNTSPLRVAVTGAAGQIGYALVFRIASGAMFGPDQPIILHLIE